MLRKYVDEILSIYNYIDGLVVTDNKGYIEYYYTFRPDLNNIREEKVLGKHILEIYPSLTKETSMIMKVINTGEPIYNKQQEVVTYLGERRTVIETTIPIKTDEGLIGVVNVSKYLVPGKDKKNIIISTKDVFTVKGNDELYTINDIITNSYSLLKIKDKILKISKTNSSVLIYGETGTGKELIAQAIHYHSSKNNLTFISQNCAAIPSNLLEGILFGTAKGAYTGAVDKKGLFELAQNGTLFLDEINSMELSLQAKILKAIETKKIRRIGGEEENLLNVRIISAVNVQPEKAVAENKIRGDLFYRLATVYLEIPPLRERKEDIKLLTEYFIDIYNNKMNKSIIGVSEEVGDIFNNYQWPGNVRELKNTIEGIFNFINDNLIKTSDLPDYYLTKDNYIPNKKTLPLMRTLKEKVEIYERQLIIEELERSNCAAYAAKKLGLSKQALRYKMIKYNLKTENFV